MDSKQERLESLKRYGLLRKEQPVKEWKGIDIEKLTQICEELYEKHKDEGTMMTTAVPWTYVYSKSIYHVDVRKAKFGNMEPKWYARFYTNGSNHPAGDFSNPLDGLIAAWDLIDEEDRKFEEKYGPFPKPQE